jgi:2-methylisocitrate lyase-like PEP mutase family enzyme
MGTVIIGEFARRVGGNFFTRTGRSFAIIGVVGCLAVAGLAAALTGAGAASSAGADIISVDRTHKGDRLSTLPKPISKVSLPAVTTLAKPPVGCEPAFSRIVDPDRAHVFGRCIS